MQSVFNKKAVKCAEKLLLVLIDLIFEQEYNKTCVVCQKDNR